MESLSMCRICLATDVRLCSIASHLQDMYERITAMKFKREDRRPLVACYVCYARLQNCYRLRTSCLRSEELLTEMMRSGVLKPQDSLNTNILTMVSVVHLSLGHSVQDSTDCLIKEEAAEIICNGELEQHHTEDIVMGVPEDDNNQSSYLVPLNVIKKEPDDFKTDIVMEVPEERHIQINDNNQYSYLVTLDAIKKDPDDFKTGIPILKKLTEPDSRLITESENKNIVYDLLIEANNAQKTNDKANILQKNKQKKIIRRKTKTDVGTSNDSLFEKRHQCSLCKKCFNNRTCLVKHTYTHTGELKCCVCNKCFTKIDHFTSHTCIHTGQKRFRCNLCDKSFHWKSLLTRHLETHSGIPVLEKLTEADSYLVTESPETNSHLDTESAKTESHLVQKSENKNIVSHKIIKASGNKHKTIDKVGVLHKNKDKKLKRNKPSKKGANLNNSYIHTGEDRFQCDVCSKSFYYKSQLVIHMTHVHSNEKLYQCTKCDKSYYWKSHLTRHMSLHTGEEVEPNGSQSANKTCLEIVLVKVESQTDVFNNTTDAQVVKLETEDENKSKLDKVTKNSAKPDDILKKRSSASSSAKFSFNNGFQCNVCNKWFRIQSHLSGHMYTHFVMKRFKCEECNIYYQFESEWARHMYAQHNIPTHFSTLL